MSTSPLSVYLSVSGWGHRDGKAGILQSEETTAACSGSLGSEFSFLVMGGSREQRGIAAEQTQEFLPGFRALQVLAAEESSG